MNEGSFSGGPGRAGEREGIQDALGRAGRHARNAASEGVLAVRALLDAVSLLQGGVPAEANGALLQAAAWLERIAAGLSGGASSDAELTHALAEALDAEIERWEERAREDPDARAVLRAFLGVRELLWELGVRPRTRSGATSEPQRKAPVRRKAPRKRRVERVPIRADPPDTLG